MADKCVLSILGSMERLWFHQSILFSEPTSLFLQLSPKTALSNSELSEHSSKSTSESPIASKQEVSSTIVPNATAPSQEEPESPQNEKESTKERPTRSNLISSKTRSHSSSPRTQKDSRKVKQSVCAPRLQKTKSLGDLELEEVKGFMDLGFVFQKENLSKKMMSLIPGLQRLEQCKKGEDESHVESSKGDDVEVEGKCEDQRVHVMRPYLSEAWKLKRPDSPLMKLRFSRVSTAADMKKHLKYWARTVAYTIQQES